MKQLLLIILVTIPINIASQTWQTLSSLPEAMVRYEDLWFINENTGWVVEAGDDKIHKTTDGGLSFTFQFQDTGAGYMRSVAFNNANLGWVGTLGGRLYRTTNGGTNWVRVDTQVVPAPSGVCDISVVGSLTMYGSGRYIGPTNIIKTTDGGVSYENIDMGAYSSFQVGIWFLNANTGFVGARSNIISEGSVVLRTTDGGNSWAKVYKSNIQNEHVWNLYFLNSLTGFGTIERFVTGNGAIVKTTNGGLNWVRIEIPITGTDLDPVGFINANTGWVANHQQFINSLKQTTNGGLNWTNLNFGSSIHGIFVVNDSIAYASGGRVYKYTSAMVGIGNSNQNNLAVRNILNQNYPNPFNPSTLISYSLIANTNVLVEIYNAAAEFIEAIVPLTRQGPGEFSVTWNAGSYPSGVYFYSLRTDLGNYYGKAILVK
ncbi:MAG: T9SS type A sorting domain-containing protein [Ignavibacteria bacterium]|nr:T9SS type A sorting domain-containing protein [Ignavibacteria bacterium]